MEPHWVSTLRNELSRRVEGGSRVCSLSWISTDTIELSLLSGQRLLTVSRVLNAKETTISELKQRLQKELAAEDVLLCQREVQLCADTFDLLPYQRSAVQYALQRSGRVLLGHEMGLGKTVITLAICANYKQDWPVLVIAPPVLLDQWADEIRRWLPEVSPDQVQLVRKATHMRNKQTVPIDILPSAKFVLVSYGMVVGQRCKRSGQQSNSQLRVTATGQPYRIVIADEAHALKSFSSLRTSTLLPLLQRSVRAILMTGTPLANSSAGDILPLMAAIVGRTHTPTIEQWCPYFCAENKPFVTPYRQIPRWIGVSPEQEATLAKLLHLFMVRRTKQEVLTELPPKRRAKVRLELSQSEMKQVTAQKKLIADFEKAIEELPEGADVESLPTHEVMKVFKLLAEAKQAAVCDWLHTVFFDEQSGEKTKVLIFVHHKCVHNRLAEFFTKHLGERGESWIQITGETSQTDRSKQLETFKSDPQCRFAVLALTACGAGLNLAVADTCVFAELCWVPSALEQAEARIHRMGQQSSSVLVYYMVAGGPASPDEVMFNALARKADTITRVVDKEPERSSSLRSSKVLTPQRKRRNRDLDREETPEPKRAKAKAKSSAMK